jgi:hypothetical protein
MPCNFIAVHCKSSIHQFCAARLRYRAKLAILLQPVKTGGFLKMLNQCAKRPLAERGEEAKPDQAVTNLLLLANAVMPL